MTLSPNELLPEGVLPVTESAVYLQDPINKSKLQHELTACISFLPTLLQPGACKDNRERSSLAGLQPDSPVLFVGASKADCKDAASSVPDSNRSGSPDLSAEMNASADQAPNPAYERLMEHLCASILLLLLAQPVQHVSLYQNRHGSLLVITSKVLENMQAAGTK